MIVVGGNKVSCLSNLCKILRIGPGIFVWKYIDFLTRKIRNLIQRKPQDALLHQKSKKIYPGLAKQDYQGLMILLVDGRCASSCEHSIERFQQMPHTLIVGQNSAGFIHYADGGRITLPNSGLSVFVTRSFYQYKDDRMVERTGYAPDVYVASGKNALDVAVRKLGHK